MSSFKSGAHLTILFVVHCHFCLFFEEKAAILKQHFSTKRAKQYAVYMCSLYLKYLKFSVLC